MIRQADVALPGLQNRVLVHHLASFRVEVKPTKEQSIVSAAKNSKYVRLSRGSDGLTGRTTVFSRRDGSVCHDVKLAPDGSLISETWQGEAREWEGGVRFPTSYLHFRYRDGKVKYVQAAAITRAAFNIGIAPTEFDVAIPAGTTVVDIRDGEPEVVRVKRDIDDLVRALSEGLPTKTRSLTNAFDEANAAASTSPRIFWIVINLIVIVLLIIATVAYRRRTTHD